MDLPWRPQRGNIDASEALLATHIVNVVACDVDVECLDDTLVELSDHVLGCCNQRGDAPARQRRETSLGTGKGLEQTIDPRTGEELLDCPTMILIAANQ